MGLYSKEPNYSYAQDLQRIRSLGADHVSLVVSWYQKNVSSTEIYPLWKPVGDFETTTDERLVEVIRQAHRAGLKVFLFPILRIEERKDREWRGSITPSHQKLWFQSYNRFILHYARIAKQNGVELFSIGSELCSMEPKLDEWTRLIKEIRGFYRGGLTYSANWDHYKKIGFWDDLDYLGLNGYYELTTNPQPTVPELAKRWWDIGNDLSSWQEQHRKQLIFTEIGYPSIDGACGKPWDYTRTTPIDLEEQATCYEAFFISWVASQKLAGVYFWNWYGEGGPMDRGYTPRGKPAEQVLTKWFGKPAISLSSASPSQDAVPPPRAISPPAPRPSYSKPAPLPPRGEKKWR